MERAERPALHESSALRLYGGISRRIAGRLRGLVRAMDEQLRSAGGEHHILLGELATYESGSADRMSISQFIAALPDDVLCDGSVWSVHAYAIRAGPVAIVDPVAALQTALDARGGCASSAKIWVTEAGAGAPHPGRARVAGLGEEKAGCAALAEQLERWSANPRVTAVFQYSFREDPAFPVGLVNASLTHLYPAYRLWLTWSKRRLEGSPPPAAAEACA